MSVSSLSYLGSQHDHDAIYPQLGRLQTSIDGTGSADGARAAALLRGRQMDWKGTAIDGTDRRTPDHYTDPALWEL